MLKLYPDFTTLPSLLAISLVKANIKISASHLKKDFRSGGGVYFKSMQILSQTRYIFFDRAPDERATSVPLKYTVDICTCMPKKS